MKSTRDAPACSHGFVAPGARGTRRLLPVVYFIFALIAAIASACVYSWLATPPFGMFGSAASNVVLGELEIGHDADRAGCSCCRREPAARPRRRESRCRARSSRTRSCSRPCPSVPSTRQFVLAVAHHDRRARSARRGERLRRAIGVAALVDDADDRRQRRQDGRDRLLRRGLVPVAGHRADDLEIRDAPSRPR